MARELLIFETASGRCPFVEWLDGLRDPKSRALVRAKLSRLELGSNDDVTTFHEGSHELGVLVASGYRIYFGVDTRGRFVILGAGRKESQRSDLELARKHWKDHCNAD